MPDQIACVACHKACALLIARATKPGADDRCSKAKCRRSPTVPIGHPCTRCEAYDMQVRPLPPFPSAFQSDGGQCVARVSLRQKRRAPDADAASSGPAPGAVSEACGRCAQFDELKAQNADLLGRMDALKARVAELERETEALKTVLAPPDDGLDLPVTPLLIGHQRSARSPASPPPSSGRQPTRMRSRYVM